LKLATANARMDRIISSKKNNHLESVIRNTAAGVCPQLNEHCHITHTIAMPRSSGGLKAGSAWAGGRWRHHVTQRDISCQQVPVPALHFRSRSTGTVLVLVPVLVLC
jgi:hypothetical protein